MQENQLEYMVSEVDSGKSLTASSEKSNRSLSLSKMYQPFDLKDLPWSYKIYTRTGTMRNGIVYPLPPSVLHTEGIVSGFWPTPTASEHKFRLKGNTQASKCLEAMARTGQLDSENIGPLNPQFVEWLMGFPIDHTALHN